MVDAALKPSCSGTLSRKDEKGSAILGLTCFRKRNLRNMCKKESCSLQKSGKQFKESNQKIVTLKIPSVPHPPFLLEAQSRAASLWDQDEKPPLSLYLQRNHKNITRKQRMGTTSVLYLLELQSISESLLFQKDFDRFLHLLPLLPISCSRDPATIPQQKSPCTSFACTPGSWHSFHRELAPPKTELCSLLSWLVQLTSSLDTGGGTHPGCEQIPPLSPQKEANSPSELQQSQAISKKKAF